MSKERETKRPNGRPQKPIDVATVEHLYSRGKSDEDVAVCLGVVRDTIMDWKNRRPEFIAAHARGKYTCRDKVFTLVWDKAESGSWPAIKLLAEQILGWNDTKSLDLHVESTFADAISSLLEHKG